MIASYAVVIVIPVMDVRVALGSLSRTMRLAKAMANYPAANDSLISRPFAAYRRRDHGQRRENIEHKDGRAKGAHENIR